MLKLFPIALLILLVSSPTNAFIFDTGVPAAAQTPLSGVDGRINYQVFSGSAGHRISNCVLVHGHGVSQKTMDMLNKVDNMKSQVPAAGELLGVLRSDVLGDLASRFGAIEQSGGPLAATNSLAKSLARLAELSAAHAFGYFYFGEYLIAGLLNNACDNVYVPVQESNQSSTLEMIVRTERFVTELCGAQPTQNSCALVGHDKGAVVVTSIVRRCAEAISAIPGAPFVVGGSEMGKQACEQITEVYSAAGAIEGGLLPVVIAGSRGLEERRKSLEKVQKWSLGFIDINKQFDEGIRKLQGIEETGEKFSIDFFGDKTSTTNPFWYDQSPIAEIDGFGEADRKIGVPIALRHGPGVTLSKTGWLGKIEYAASSTAFRFDTAKYTEEVVNDLKRPRLDPTDPDQLTIYLPPIPLRPKFLPFDGARLRNQSPERVAQRQKAKERLDFFSEPFIHSQHIARGMLDKMVAEAHGDSQIATTLKWGLENIATYAKENGLTDAKGKTTYLNRFRLLPGEKSDDGIYFQESDGLTETGTALGLCKRSMKLPAEINIIASCATFAKTNHLGLSGMSIDAADHIVKQLSERQLSR